MSYATRRLATVDQQDGLGVALSPFAQEIGYRAIESITIFPCQFLDRPIPAVAKAADVEPHGNPVRRRGFRRSDQTDTAR